MPHLRGGLGSRAVRATRVAVDPRARRPLWTLPRYPTPRVDGEGRAQAACRDGEGRVSTLEVSTHEVSTLYSTLEVSTLREELLGKFRKETHKFA